MPYFKPIKLLYLHVPKTGGMSIEEYFYNKYNITRHETNIYGYYYDKTNRIRVENERTLQHLTYNEIIERKQWFDIDIGHQSTSNMKILVSVRNPFDRIVSELFWNKKSGVTEETTPEEFFVILKKYLYEDTSSTTTNFIDNHKTPQYKFILDENQRIIKNNIFFVRTETLAQDMHMLGFPDFNIHQNKNAIIQVNDYTKYLNESSMDLIINYYSADFIHFGYSTDITNRSVSPIRYQKIPRILEFDNYGTTIVTAFIRDVNKGRIIDEYIEFGKKLLSISVSKIVFIDSRSYHEYFSNCLEEFPLTRFILFELNEMYYYGLRHLITDFNLITNNPEKDTIEYIFVQCHKTEWVRKAIEINVFSSSQFIWIDFGIFHMIRDETVLQNAVIKMTTKTYSKLRIATCKSRHYICPYDVYKQLTWNFAGSVFGGDAISLITFADITKEKILDTIHHRHSIMWELSVWYLIKDVVPDLYDCYITGHDHRILELY